MRHAHVRYVKCLFTNIQKQQNKLTSRINNSRILKIRNVKFAGYCFYVNENIQGDFQICISIPLIHFGRLRLRHTTKANFIKYQTADPEIR